MDLRADKGEKSLGRAARRAFADACRPAGRGQGGGRRDCLGQRRFCRLIARDEIAEAFLDAASAPAALVFRAPDPAPEFRRFGGGGCAEKALSAASKM